MGTWVDLGSDGVVNLDQVTKIQIYGSGATGDAAFYFPDGSFAVGTLGASDPDALAAIKRLVDAVDPADYS